MQDTVVRSNQRSCFPRARMCSLCRAQSERREGRLCSDQWTPRGARPPAVPLGGTRARARRNALATQPPALQVALSALVEGSVRQGGDESRR